MQGGFIGKIKKGYKSVKQDISGADIFGAELLPNEPIVLDRYEALEGEVREKEFEIEFDVKKLEFIKEYESHNLGVEKTKTSIYSKEFQVDLDTYEIVLDEKAEVEVEKIVDYDRFETEVIEKGLEEFHTTVLYELVEKTKKAKIHGSKEKGIKTKIINGKDIIYEVPKVFQGRRYIGKKEMLDIAVKVKEAKPNFDFTRYRFLAIFEDLPVAHMRKFKYKEDTKELLFFFDKKSKKTLEDMSLVVWGQKNSAITEKIFI